MVVGSGAFQIIGQYLELTLVILMSMPGPQAQWCAIALMCHAAR